MAVVGKTRQRAVVLASVLSGVATAAPAMAQEYPEPTNRNHTIDLFLGQAIGSARIIGMGGTATATAHGSSGMIANPAAPAVRTTTSHNTWDWDWHLDSMSPTLGSDHDNNGIATREVGVDSITTFGLVLQYKDWGFGITATGLLTQNSVDGLMSDDNAQVRSEGLVNQIAIARHFLDGALVAGISARGVLLEVTSFIDDEQQTLLELTGGSFEGGLVWKPTGKSMRLGASLRLPVVSDDSTIADCDPLDCAGYILPEKVKVPWEASFGIAGRRGPSAWNRTAKTRWVDEKALLWAADLVLTGKTQRGVGLEAFGQHQLQPAGRKYSLSVRGGVDYEWFPGRLRVRGGTYFEPGRFKDTNGEDIPGRMHLTVGADVRVWQFEFWDDPYRVRLSLTSDVARNFANGGLSIGFWH